MGVDYLQKYGKPRKPPEPGECLEISDVPVRYIEFRDQGNNTVAIQYSHITVVACNPSTTLTLRFGKLLITITGSNLLPLVPLFSDRRVTLCRPVDARGVSGNDPIPVITKIDLPDSIKPKGWEAVE